MDDYFVSHILITSLNPNSLLTSKRVSSILRPTLLAEILLRKFQFHAIQHAIRLHVSDDVISCLIGQIQGTISSDFGRLRPHITSVPFYVTSLYDEFVLQCARLGKSYLVENDRMNPCFWVGMGMYEKSNTDVPREYLGYVQIGASAAGFLEKIKVIECNNLRYINQALCVARNVSIVSHLINLGASNFLQAAKYSIVRNERNVTRILASRISSDEMKPLLMFACEHGSIFTVQILIETLEAQIDAEVLTASVKCFNVCRYLVDRGAKDSQDGIAFSVALIGGKKRTCRLFLRKRTIDVGKALAISACNGDIGMCVTCLQHGMSMDDAENAAIVACQYDHFDIHDVISTYINRRLKLR